GAGAGAETGAGAGTGTGTGAGGTSTSAGTGTGGTDPAAEEAGVRALYRFLRATPARMVGVWLPDAVGDRRPQNLPGTWDQYPNWRLPIADAEGRPVTLEDLAASPRLHALVDAVRHPGRAGPGGVR
ncbi:hypothetical protein NGM37_54930, partial [Streptomyces sp. TRM76130]|nr:hypothetical protein [Streptomyces sp. TRM76130]